MPVSPGWPALSIALFTVGGDVVRHHEVDGERSHITQSIARNKHLPLLSNIIK